jgi:hypothetical protein
MAEFDLFKFFNQIPWKAFEDTHAFFGFDEDTIALARLFWMNFQGRARSRYNHAET